MPLELNPNAQGTALTPHTKNKNGVSGVSDPLSSTSSALQDEAQNASSTGDTVEITHHADALRRAEQKIQALPVVDTSKVQRIQTAIRSGVYRVDAASLAEKMIAFEQAREK